MQKNLFLFNTLARQKELFVPMKPPAVSLYCCGPTVYNTATIGNLRTYINEDILRRVLEFSGLEVRHAMNITDVGHLVSDSDEGQDKLEIGAAREGLHPLEIARKYEAKFFEDFEQLQCEKPSVITRATDAIQAQITLIEELEKKGYTYQDEYAIYFDTSKLHDYGKLTGQRNEDKIVGAREEVVIDERKRQPQDFVLWFFLAGRYKSHVLHWASPWGEGFPGWHLECSAIVRQSLGQPIDIHAGGVDHIGTHHTNEIAQSEAAYNEPLAHYWFHTEFLMVNGKRMGKSEGNVLTLGDILSRGFSPLDFRYLCLMAHYRSKMNFTWEALESARRTRLGILQLVHREQGPVIIDEITKEKIWAALADDCDTPRALALLHESRNPGLWRFFEPILRLGVDEYTPLPVPEDIQDLVDQRTHARAEKDWAKADELRQELISKGYDVLDSKEGTEVIPIDPATHS